MQSVEKPDDRPFILYVEDEETERASMARMLEHHVGRVAAASDAQEAFRLFLDKRPDLVLTDIRMPGEDGLAMAKRMRAHDPSVPVVLISAHNDNDYLREALRVGVRDFLFKPVRIPQLAGTLERVLEENRLSRQYDLLRLHNLPTDQVGEMAQFYRYLKPLADASPLMIWMDDEKGNCLYANGRFSAFVGRSTESLLGDGWVSSVHPDDLEKCVQTMQEAVSGQTSFEVECRLRRYDGEYRNVYNHGVPRFDDERFSGFVGVSMDVTDVRQTKAALEANLRYKTLFETMLTGFALHEVICDESGKPVDYRFLEVNPAFEKMVGLSADALVGKTVLEVLPKTEPVWIERYGQVALDGARLEFEEYAQSLDKHFFVTAFSARKGQFAVMAQDITARKRAAEELEAVNRTLESRVAQEVQKRQKTELALMQQSRASAMGEMLSAMAHHWRQPLSAVALYIQGIKESFHVGDLTAEYLDSAIDHSMDLIMQMSKTIDSVRGFASTREGLLRCCALEEVKQVMALAQPELEMLGINIKTHCFGQEQPLLQCACPSKKAGWVNLYPTEFRQVVFNLLTNARDAILARRQKEGDRFKPQITIGLEVDGDQEVLTIEDNGGGMNQEAIAHLFQPFFTTKDRGRGTGVISGVGLGLYLSKMVIEEQMGGRLWIENAQEGTRASIMLTLANERAEPDVS